jgi:hypothetical protein
MKMIPLLFGFFAAFSFCGAYPSYAQEKYVLPIEKKMYQGIPYLCGGIGVDEREALDSMGRGYNLKLMFALKGRAYLSDIRVEISERTGEKVLDVIADGPWFFTDLAPGKYTITVSMRGKTQQKAVDLGTGKRQVSVRFYWSD